MVALRNGGPQLSPTVVIECQRNFCFLPVALQIQIRTARFLQVFTATQNSLCLLFYEANLSYTHNISYYSIKIYNQQDNFQRTQSLSNANSNALENISSHFRDNVLQRYCGHDLDLSRSRDVIGHVTI